MHKYDLRLVYNHSCPQSFHGLSDVKGISLGQYDSSILTFTGHLHLAGIMLKARGAKRKPHHLSPRSPESNGREKQINTQLQQAVLNCQDRHTNAIGAKGRDFITMRISGQEADCSSMCKCLADHESCPTEGPFRLQVLLRQTDQLSTRCKTV